MSLLSIKGISKRFGGLQALNDVSIEVRPLELTAIIGPNGAGKTTTFNLITGFHRPDSGTVTFEGERIEGLPAHEIARRGLMRTFQHTRLFNAMTVLGNVLVGRHSKTSAELLDVLLGRAFAAREKAESQERAMEALRFVGLDHAAGKLAGALPHGQRRLLEIARVLVAEPRLVLLDEPTTGLNSGEVRVLQDKMHALIERGISILMVEHDMRLVMEIADNIHVLDFGQKIAEGPPGVVRRNPDVIAAYLGGTVAC
jgi:ABC-type branched-subunit amino acid transport system ATPase component